MNQPLARPKPRRPGGLPRLSSSGARSPGDGTQTPERLQKVMAQSGIDSRRRCEELIQSGRVQVDGQIVTELGTRVRPDQEVRVDGSPLVRMGHVYFLINKPQGVVSTNDDPSGRTRVIDLLPETRERLFTVGRLDMSSEGLMLVTNDGELANRLAHPRYGVEKTYHVLVAGSPDLDVIAMLRRGVHLAEGSARAVSVRVKKAMKQSTLLEIVLQEGKNREIRRMLAKVGHKVLRLKRIAIGSLRLGELPPAEFRRLTPDELRALRNQNPLRKPRRSRLKRGTAKSGAAKTGAAQQDSAGRASAGRAPEGQSNQPNRSGNGQKAAIRNGKSQRPVHHGATPGRPTGNQARRGRSDKKQSGHPLAALRPAQPRPGSVVGSVIGGDAVVAPASAPAAPSAPRKADASKFKKTSARPGGSLKKGMRRPAAAQPSPAPNARPRHKGKGRRR